MYKHLTLSGGGIRGANIVGALLALEETGHLDNIETYMGSSVGSILAFGLNAGYKASEIKNIVTEIDFAQYKSITPSLLLTDFGLDSGAELMRLLKAIFSIKVPCDITFQQLFERTGKRLIITGTCLNTHNTEYFSNKESPEMVVLDAVRISIACPAVFTVVRHNGKTYSDGAILCPIPFNYLTKEERKETIGILVHDINESSVESLEDFALSMLYTVINKMVMDTYDKYKRQIILIESSVDSMNFNLTRETKQNMIKEGYENGISFVDALPKTTSES